MSQALTHFAVGATVTVLVLTYLVPVVPYPRLLSLAGGGWAMVPDLHQVTPVYEAEFAAVHGSPVTDVFFLHYTLDAVDPANSNRWAAVAVAALLLATAIAERREYRALRRVRDAVEERR